MSKNQKILISVCSIILAVFLFFANSFKIPFLDSKTDSYFNEAITKAGLAYATTRAINASVSIIKESTLQLEPAGLGVSLAVGQALDPIDDMTERLSDVIVLAITSLLLLLLVARFTLPLSSLANSYIYQNYFDIQITQAKENLTNNSSNLNKLQEFTLPQKDGFWNQVKDGSEIVAQKVSELKNTFLSLLARMENFINNLLKLTFLYVGLFIIQVLILPILSFWLLKKLSDSLFQKGT